MISNKCFEMILNRFAVSEKSITFAKILVK